MKGGAELSGLRRVQVTGVGAFNFANQELGKAWDSLDIVRVGLGLVANIDLQIFQGSPRHEVGREFSFLVAGEDAPNFRDIVAGMKGRGEMTTTGRTAVLEPLSKLLPIKMQGVEVLEIVVGEKEIRNACGFARVVIGTVLVIPMIEVEVGPEGAFSFPLK